MLPIKYPRTTSELHRLINFLDFKIKEIKDSSKKATKEWLNLCYFVSQILTESLSKAKKENKSQDNIDFKIANTLEKWMRINKIRKI